MCICINHMCVCWSIHIKAQSSEKLSKEHEKYYIIRSEEEKKNENNKNKQKWQKQKLENSLHITTQSTNKNCFFHEIIKFCILWPFSVSVCWS